MAQIPDYILGLLENPTENLKTELKDWIDPDEDEAKAKIVKACLALRNLDGGVLLIGVSDKPRRRNAACPLEPVEETFEQEKIQRMVARYADPPFEIRVRHVPLDGIRYVAIEVPGGIQYPVMTKRGLTAKKDEKQCRLIKKKTIYVRTLRANGSASTAELTDEDVGELLERYSKNREARVERPGDDAREREPDWEAAIQNLMDKGLERYDELAAKRGNIPEHGSFEVGVVLERPGRAFDPTGEFLQTLMARHPYHTGSPMWWDSRASGNTESHPKVRGDRWEAFIALPRDISDLPDYWHLSGKGEFYERRAFRDDTTAGPSEEMDRDQAILRTAEAILVAMEFAKPFELPEDASLRMGFRWRGLVGRILSTRGDDRVFMLRQPQEARDNEAQSFVEIPSIAARDSVGGYVKAAVRPLFLKFNGVECSAGLIEKLMARLIARQIP